MFKVLALDMVSPPNVFGYADQNVWRLNFDGAATLWGMLYVVDSLSERRYLPVVGGTLQVTFYRADQGNLNQSLANTDPDDINIAYEQQVQMHSFWPDNSKNIVKTVVFSVQDASLFSFSLTEQEVKKLHSGTVHFTLTEGAVVTNWNQNWTVRKSPVRTGS
jgi:hypothetical protein